MNAVTLSHETIGLLRDDSQTDIYRVAIMEAMANGLVFGAEYLESRQAALRSFLIPSRPGVVYWAHALVLPYGRVLMWFEFPGLDRPQWLCIERWPQSRYASLAALLDVAVDSLIEAETEGLVVVGV